MQKVNKPNLSSDYLHLGCGLIAPTNWLNVDGSWQVVLARWPTVKKLLVRLRLYPAKQAEIPWPTNVLRIDLRKPLPFPDSRFMSVYSSHTLEHLYCDEALDLLKECYRVLKPNGICRVVVPDLHAAITNYMSLVDKDRPDAADKLMEELLMHPRTTPRGLLGKYRQFSGFLQHKWMYDKQSLVTLMSKAGFTQITTPEYMQTRLTDLQSVEGADRILGGVGIVAEGVK